MRGTQAPTRCVVPSVFRESASGSHSMTEILQRACAAAPHLALYLAAMTAGYPPA